MTSNHSSSPTLPPSPAARVLPYVDADTVNACLPYPALIDALRDGFAMTASAPRRHVHHPSPDTTLLLMPAWQERHLGVKLVNVVPQNRQRGQRTVQALFVLMDTATGAPLAIMDGDALTVRRTAATSALASRWLSRPDSRHLLLVGTGHLAPEMALAHCNARAIAQVTVWGRDAARARATAEQLRARGLAPAVKIDVAMQLDAACAAADIICCATTSAQPLVHAAHVKPGTHVDLVGGFRPDMREADDALMASASLFVDTMDGALAEAGDLVQPMLAGLISASSVRADLAALARAEHAGRQHASEITVFKSVGTALSDLCAAELAWQQHSSAPRADQP